MTKFKIGDEVTINKTNSHNYMKNGIIIRCRHLGDNIVFDYHVKFSDSNLWVYDADELIPTGTTKFNIDFEEHLPKEEN